MLKSSDGAPDARQLSPCTHFYEILAFSDTVQELNALAVLLEVGKPLAPCLTVTFCHVAFCGQLSTRLTSCSRAGRSQTFAMWSSVPHALPLFGVLCAARSCGRLPGSGSVPALQESHMDWGCRRWVGAGGTVASCSACGLLRASHAMPMRCLHLPPAPPGLPRQLLSW